MSEKMPTPKVRESSENNGEQKLPMSMFSVDSFPTPANDNRSPEVVTEAERPTEEVLHIALEQLDDAGVTSPLLAEAQEMLADYKNQKANTLGYRGWEDDEAIQQRLESTFTAKYGSRLDDVAKIVKELQAEQHTSTTAVEVSPGAPAVVEEVTPAIESEPTPVSVFGMQVPPAGATGIYSARSFYRGLDLLYATQRVPTDKKDLVADMMRLTQSVPDSGLTEADAEALERIARAIDIPESVINRMPEKTLPEALNERVEALRHEAAPSAAERAQRLAQKLSLFLTTEQRTGGNESAVPEEPFENSTVAAAPVVAGLTPDFPHTVPKNSAEVIPITSRLRVEKDQSINDLLDERFGERFAGMEFDHRRQVIDQTIRAFKAQDQDTLTAQGFTQKNIADNFVKRGQILNIQALEEFFAEHIQASIDGTLPASAAIPQTVEVGVVAEDAPSTELSTLITPDAVQAYRQDYPGGEVAWERDFETYMQTIIPNAPTKSWNRWFTTSDNSARILFDHVVEGNMTIEEFTALRTDSAAQRSYLSPVKVTVDTFASFATAVTAIEQSRAVAIQPEMSVLEMLQAAFVAQQTAHRTK